MVWSLALCPDDAKKDPVVYGAEFGVVFLSKMETKVLQCTTYRLTDRVGNSLGIWNRLHSRPRDLKRNVDLVIKNDWSVICPLCC